MKRIFLILVCLTSVALAAPAFSKTLRWASRGDVQTLDPDSFNENLTTNLDFLIYEPLVDWDRNLKIVPSLATTWSIVNDTTWRFTLRSGVNFADGTPFTAADAVFSIERAQQRTSQLSQYARALGTPVQIDDHTIELHTAKPNPILLQHLATIPIMSKAWCIANHVEKPLDFSQKEESFAGRNANGTGPYMLKSREPGVRTVYVANPHWWGHFEGNVTELVYTPIASDPTRTAALLSGDVDFVHDPSPQDVAKLATIPAMHVTTGFENRVLFFGMDQSRDELLYSSVKGKNPFKDLRVRQAFYEAIDAQAIKTMIMRGQASPTGCMATARQGCPDPDQDAHPPINLVHARELMKEAGYENGFALTLDCPNDRYVNDRDICIALVGMLAKIGVTLNANTIPKALFFPKIEKFDTSFYFMGWGGSVVDAQIVFDPIVHSFDATSQKGTSNFGRYVDPELDHLIDAAATEMNPVQRTKLLAAAMAREQAEVHYLPLQRPGLNWVSRTGVRPVMLPNNIVHVEWIHID